MISAIGMRSSGDVMSKALLTLLSQKKTRPLSERAGQVLREELPIRAIVRV
jgi:hypothetical protein